MISCKRPRWVNAQPSLGTTGPELSPQNLRDWVWRVMTCRGLEEKESSWTQLFLWRSLYLVLGNGSITAATWGKLLSRFSFNLTHWRQKLISNQVHVKEIELAFSLSRCHRRDLSIKTDEKKLKYFFSLERVEDLISAFLTNNPNHLAL